MTRSLYDLIESHSTWCNYLAVSGETQVELHFWRSNVERYNSQSIWRSPSAIWLIYSDASDTGHGGYLVEHGTFTMNGQWSPAESAQS